MDRLNLLRGSAAGSSDSTLDVTTSSPDGYLSAFENTKYFSLSEVNSSFDISPIKDVSLAATADPDTTITEDALVQSLSPIEKKSELDDYKIGEQIEAANILSGGVDIFEDNDNSYDGHELVIDDNIDIDGKTDSDVKRFDTLEYNSDKIETVFFDEHGDVSSKNTQEVLHIEGKNIEAVDIGNGLYLYRKNEGKELAAIQFINDDDKQQPSFKFLKVRYNAEGNLEVYEEIQRKVPKEIPAREETSNDKNTSHVPIRGINTVISDSASNKVVDKISQKEQIISSSGPNIESKTKSEISLNGKMIKLGEPRKSSVIGSYALHSTPNKEGKPFTKTMIDLQLYPNKHSDNINKTIEVRTDNCKQKILKSNIKNEDSSEQNEPNSLSIDKKNSAMITEISEENSEAEKIINFKPAVISLKDDVVHPLETVKEIVELNESIELTEQRDNASETNINDILEPQISTKDTEIMDEITVLGCTKENTSNNDFFHQSTKKSEVEDRKNISNIDIKDNISTNESSEDLVKSNTVEKSSSTEVLKKKLCPQDEQTQNNGKNNNKGAILKDNICDAIVNREILNENSSINVAKESPVPKDNNETINLDKEECVTENDTVNDITKEQNILSEMSEPDDIIDKAVKNKVRNINEITSNTVGKVTDEIQAQINNKSKKENKEDQNLEVSLNNKSKVLQSECSLNVHNNNDDNFLKLSSTEKSNQSKENPSSSSVTSTTDKPNSDNNIIQQENGNDTFTSNKEEIQQKTEIDVDFQVPDEIETKNEDIDSQKDNKVDDDDSKPSCAVPFGKWTEANRQEFLNKIKGSRNKEVNSSNTNQIKNSHDLNRRDFLKKIDSRSKHASTSRGETSRTASATPEPVFTNKPALVTEESKIINEVVSKIPIKTNASTSKEVTSTVTSFSNQESIQRKAVKDLIDKTIEGMIIKSSATESKPNTNISTTLDDIEMKMNELHGIPFIERPLHELPQVSNPVSQNLTYSKPEQENSRNDKPSKVPQLLSLINKNTQKLVKCNAVDVDSDESIIDHEPVTGDIEVKLNLPSNTSVNEKHLTKSESLNSNMDNSKKESTITEKDFDKFARRNSVTYDNCLTVNFEKQESVNISKTVLNKDKAPKMYSKKEDSRIDSKQKIPSKLDILPLNIHKVQSSTKSAVVIEDSLNKNYHSKVQKAYKTALTAKRQLSCPITIIEDQPVKVVFMDTKTDFVPNLQNVQGQELSPSKNHNTDDNNTISTTDSIESDMMDYVDGVKPQDDGKLKTKHQRKQILTPVVTPELELIEPSDLGIDVSPKKKRKIDDSKADKISKKSYLLGRTGVGDKILKTQNISKNDSQSTLNGNVESVPNKDTVTAIDNLVKAAELLDNRSENIDNSIISKSEHLPTNTPIKRGRGRPRKYPLPDGATNKTKVPSPKKKPRLIDAKPNKLETEDEESTDGEEVKENWTMGKINENIVCPICNKLFRSENVVFKHVKHCSGPSPNRSDASKRSGRRGRRSQGSDDKSHESQDDMYLDEDKSFEDIDNIRKEYKSKNSIESINNIEVDNEVITIDDTIIEEKSIKDEEKQVDSELKNVIQNKSSNNLECEVCGKTFRQLSYLVNHKLHHKKQSNSTPTAKSFRKKSTEEVTNMNEKQETSKLSEDPSAGFRCEPCDKSFRKLHHLVEHREKHDGINRQKLALQNAVDNPVDPPQCDVCKKTFQKVKELIEHKEQHVDTSSEKSDDKSVKSVKSSLSTKDIIHECSLCYMVFPNEHSLNKHTVICQRKKRQSKQAKPNKEGDSETIETETDNIKIENEVKIEDADEPEVVLNKVEIINLDISHDEINKTNHTDTLDSPTVPEPAVDDEEVRYMLNPKFKSTADDSFFMKVLTKKRNSLEIARPNSKNLIKRRPSLQNVQKIRLKPNLIESNVTEKVKITQEESKLSTTISTDSDDSDVKYSLPKTKVEKLPKPINEQPSKEPDNKKQRKSIISKTKKPVEQKKSLSGIAKRKSLGRPIVARPNKMAPTKQVKRRTAEAEHRCDCGQLFSSAALLSRHTSLDHTPPRIRKRRSPPPDDDHKSKPSALPTRKTFDKPKKAVTSRKSSILSNVSGSKQTITSKKSSISTNVCVSKQTIASRKSSIPSNVSGSKQTIVSRKSSIPSIVSGSKQTISSRKSSTRSDISTAKQSAASRKSSTKSDISTEKKTIKSRKSSARSDDSSLKQSDLSKKLNARNNANTSKQSIALKRSSNKSDISIMKPTIASKITSTRDYASTSKTKVGKTEARKSIKLREKTEVSPQTSEQLSSANKSRRSTVAHKGVPVPEKMKKMKFKI